MSNHVNYRRVVRRESRFRVDRDSNKSPHKACTAYLERKWNRQYRRQGTHYCRMYYRLNHTMFSGYPEEEKLHLFPANRRPYLN